MIGLVESTTQMTSIEQVYDLVGQEITARWEQLGTIDSKTHWQYGAEASALIAERVPAMLVYKAIAKKAGKSSQTIRKAYYTYHAFTPIQREKYHLAPYSVFQHARTNKHPEKVLQHYIDNACSVDEIEAVFPIIENEEIEKEFSAKGYPRMFYGIMREAWGIDPFLKARIDEHLQGIKDIFEQVNNENDYRR